MRRWGYRHVITPMVESMNVLELGLGAEQRRRLFKFTDSGGDVVALVGERTVPVARLVAGKLRSTALPVRLCYAGPVLSADAFTSGARRTSGRGAVGARGAIADAGGHACRVLEAGPPLPVDVGTPSSSRNHDAVSCLTQ
jgi:ATP phosphoribosyltransferase regulatory subunit